MIQKINLALLVLAVTLLGFITYDSQTRESLWLEQRRFEPIQGSPPLALDTKTGTLCRTTGGEEIASTISKVMGDVQLCSELRAR